MDKYEEERKDEIAAEKAAIDKGFRVVSEFYPLLQSLNHLDMEPQPRKKYY